MSLENLALRSLAEADESTARAVRELLRLKAKVIELTPIPRGDVDRQSEMLVRGRGMVPEEAWRLIPVVDEAVSSIVELERRRQELSEACAKEEVAITELQCRLNSEEQRRLVVLPAAVQQEHEAGLRDMAELKWLVAFNRRQCDRLHGRLEDVAREDSDLLTANKRYKQMVPTMVQKEKEEEQNIDHIKKQQKQVLCDLREAEEVQKDREGLHLQMLQWAEEERGRLAAAHSSLQQSRDQCRMQDASQLKELSRVDNSVAAAQKEIAAVEREGHRLDEEDKVVAQKLSVWEGTVSRLSEKRQSLQRELDAAQQASTGLTETLDSRVLKLDGDVAAARGKLKSLGKTFRELRGANEELRQDGDELQERIAQRRRQRKDAERGVVRACAEMKSLTEQLQLKANQNRVMETELTWKATVEALATQQREECKTRTVYESKMAVEEQDLQEAEDDHRKKVSKIMKVLESSVEKAEVQEAKTKMAEEEHARWLDMVSAKETQLQSIQERVEQLEDGLEQVRRDILPQLRTHKRESALRERQIRAMREKMPEMECSIEDLEKCSSVLMHQIEGLSTHAATMATSLKSLESSIASEQLAVTELKGQLQRIQEFGQKASNEYQQFLSGAAQQLLAAQDQLCHLLSHNRRLASTYRQQQKACLKQKARTVATMDASAEGEATCQDYYQVQSAAAAKECQKKWLRWIASCHDSHKSQHQLSLNRISAARKHLLGSVAVSQAYINSELADNPLLYPIAT